MSCCTSTQTLQRRCTWCTSPPYWCKGVSRYKCTPPYSLSAPDAVRSWTSLCSDSWWCNPTRSHLNTPRWAALNGGELKVRTIFERVSSHIAQGHHIIHGAPGASNIDQHQNMRSDLQSLHLWISGIGTWVLEMSYLQCSHRHRSRRDCLA